MKIFIALFFSFPFIVLAQVDAPVKLLTPVSDTLVFAVRVAPENSRVLADSVVLKALLEKLNAREEKSAWGWVSAFSIALIPLVVGFFAFMYTRSQAISNARIEWIKNFRPLVSTFITGILRVQTAFQEYKLCRNVKERDAEIVQSLQEKRGELSKRRATMKPSDPNVSSTDNALKEVSDEISSAESKANSSNIDLKQSEANFKKEFFTLHQSLNEVMISLDPGTYGEAQETLSSSLQLMMEYDGSQKPEEYAVVVWDIHRQIQAVLSQQWRMAEGKRLFWT